MVGIDRRYGTPFFNQEVHEVFQEVEVLALLWAGDGRRGLDVQQRRAFRPQRRALKPVGQEPVGPVGRAALGKGEFRQHDETREIGVLGAQAQVDPRTQRRVASEAVAGVDVEVGGGVVDRYSLQPAVETDLVGHLGQLFKAAVHPCSAVAGLSKYERALDVVPLARTHRALFFAGALEFLQVQLAQLGLGVEGVQVRRPAFHVQEDAVLGRGVCMVRPRGGGGGGGL